MKVESKIKNITSQALPFKKVIISGNMNDHSNDPFVIKKMERARATISKCGFPPGTVPSKEIDLSK
jgi:hypothetical protein